MAAQERTEQRQRQRPKSQEPGSMSKVQKPEPEASTQPAPRKGAVGRSPQRHLRSARPQPELQSRTRRALPTRAHADRGNERPVSGHPPHPTPPGWLVIGDEDRMRGVADVGCDQDRRPFHLAPSSVPSRPDHPTPTLSHARASALKKALQLAFGVRRAGACITQSMRLYVRRR